jgi:hypothetical protein
MMPATEGMPASEATGSRGAVTGDGRTRRTRTRRVSQTTANKAIGCNQGGIVIESYCCLTSSKSERPPTALVTPGGPSNRQEAKSMTTNVFLPYCLTVCRICESPKRDFAGAVRVKAVL